MEEETNNNLLNFKKKASETWASERLSDYLTIMHLTKNFYQDLKPYFKYKIVYTLAKILLDFRDNLNYNIKIARAAANKEKKDGKEE